MIVILITIYASWHIVFNPSLSVKRGYYAIWRHSSYAVGNTVLLCVTNKPHLKIMHQLGLPYASHACVYGAPFLLKTIVAKHNDVIRITPLGVYVNNYLEANSQSLQSYHHIKLLPMRQQSFRLGNNQFFVLGFESHSYDSRYFGVININQIHAKATYL